jgi:hypothetical protein
VQLRHARTPVDGDLVEYFWAAVKKNYCKDHGRNPLAQLQLARHRRRPLRHRLSIHLVGASSTRPSTCGPVSAGSSDRDRDIVLRDFEGETSQEIADAIGPTMTAANVRQRSSRAYKKMAAN